MVLGRNMFNLITKNKNHVLGRDSLILRIGAFFLFDFQVPSNIYFLQVSLESYENSSI